MKMLMVVVGTRPNFIKVTRFKAVAAERGMEVQLVHTGQHYDEKMSTVFFDQFGLLPDHFLNTPPPPQSPPTQPRQSPGSPAPPPASVSTPALTTQPSRHARSKTTKATAAIAGTMTMRYRS